MLDTAARTCAACLDPIPAGATHRYRRSHCTVSCREWHRRHPGEIRVRRPCARCGTLLPVNARPERRWCSSRCKEARKRDPLRDQLERYDDLPPPLTFEPEMLPWLMDRSSRALPDDPDPLPDPPAWAADAACLGMDPGLWFPQRGQSAAAGLEVCESCPVRVECAEFAISEQLAFGTWGGLSERARRPLLDLDEDEAA